jgi:phosphoglucomutase
MYDRWLKSPVVDDETKKELIFIGSDEEEIADRFSQMMTFGTAGIRGKMRAGMNGMNVYTVRYVSQALSDYIRGLGEDLSRGITIAYDSRNNSRLFAEEAAGVFAANGIKVHIFDGIRPTPELSFAVRESHSLGGINITASHNTKEYNGYKVYGEDGSQLSPEATNEITAIIEKTDIFDDVKRTPFDAALKNSMIEVIGEEIDEKYMEAVIAEAGPLKCPFNCISDFKIVYTPFHGTGAKFVPKLLNKIGIENIICVPEQMVADGNFPTVKSPNPENFESFKMAIGLAEACDGDLILGTDPDGDRLGIVVRHEGSYVPLTGNQVGVMLLDFLIKTLKPDKENFVVKSLVSTGMADEVCRKYGLELFETPPGFKHVGEKINTYDEEGKQRFFFAFEESNGYLKGTYTRDKDAMLASVMVADMACAYKRRGMTLVDGMEALYQEYGYYQDKSLSHYMDVAGSKFKMDALMDKIRKSPPHTLGDIEVERVKDFLQGSVKDCITGKERRMDLPNGNIIRYELADGSSVTIRPSGTEPKVKLYVTVRGSNEEEADGKLEKVVSDAENLLEL